jgi:hypothetical protein
MTSKCLFLPLAALAAVLSSKAQEPEKLAALPDQVSLVKQFTYPVPEKAKISRPQFPNLEKVELVRTGTTSKKIEYFSDGSVTEMWKFGAIHFLISSSLPDQIMVTNSEMKSDEEQTGSGAETEFPELDWIADSKFLNTKTRNGVKCRVYQSENKTVWITEKTLKPVFFRSPEMQVSYSFQSPPGEPLRLPDKFAEKLESVKKAWGGRKD